MKNLYSVLLVVTAFFNVSGAYAQNAIPDVKGTWIGKGAAVVFGSSHHHPGSHSPIDPARFTQVEWTDVVDGQNGRLVWGRSSSALANTQEPFAWAITGDNRTIVGADVDGHFHITLLGPDRMEKCYVQNGIGPSKAIVATCYELNRVKK
jgi:hypothetical protein